MQLLGRVTYEGFAEAWPSREGPFAEKLNNEPKVRGLDDAHRPAVAEHDRDHERRRRAASEAEGTRPTGSILVAGSGRSSRRCSRQTS